MRVLCILNWTLLLRRFFLWETLWTEGGVQDVSLNRCWFFGLSSIGFGVFGDTVDGRLVLGFCEIGCWRLGENDRAGAGIWLSSAGFRAQTGRRLRRNICRSAKTVLKWGAREPVHHNTRLQRVYNGKRAKNEIHVFSLKSVMRAGEKIRSVPELDSESSSFFKIHRCKFNRGCTVLSWGTCLFNGGLNKCFTGSGWFLMLIRRIPNPWGPLCLIILLPHWFSWEACPYPTPKWLLIGFHTSVPLRNWWQTSCACLSRFKIWTKWFTQWTKLLLGLKLSCYFPLLLSSCHHCCLRAGAVKEWYEHWGIQLPEQVVPLPRLGCIVPQLVELSDCGVAEVSGFWATVSDSPPCKV